jgi:hypothetical protein
MLIAACQADDAVRHAVARVHSLATGPLPVNVKVVKAGTGVRVLLDSRFANGCLANAGATGRFADLTTAEWPTTRILLLEQHYPPDGCPDIYQPATRTLAVPIEDSSGVEQLALIDGSTPSDIWLIPLEPSGEAADAALGMIGLEPLFPVPILPHLAQTGGLAFEVDLPAECGPEDLQIDIREGRTAIEGQLVAPVPLWLQVGLAKPECGREATTTHAVGFEIPSSDLVLDGRVMILVNPLIRGSDRSARPFQRLSP